MSLSRYFHALRDGYFAELDDLSQDSEGRDVLAARLRDKRDAFATLIDLLEVDPLMAAPALHGAFALTGARMPALDALLDRDPESFLPWSEVSAPVQVAAWAVPLIERALGHEQGEAFLCTVLGLEYLHARERSGGTVGAGGPDAPVDAARDGGRDGDGDDDTDGDADRDADGTMGEDFLEQQGFDRRTAE